MRWKKHRSAYHLAFRQLDRHWKIHPIERSCEMERSCENAWIAWVPAHPIPSHIDSCRQMKDVKWDIREKCKHAAHYCPWSSISPLCRGQSLGYTLLICETVVVSANQNYWCTVMLFYHLSFVSPFIFTWGELRNNKISTTFMSVKLLPQSNHND